MIDKIIDLNPYIDLIVKDKKKKTKEIVEIIKRTTKGRIQKIVKVAVESIQDDNVKKDVEKLANQVRNIKEISKFGNLLNWVNAGLNTANLCATVAGILILKKKLDEISVNLNEMQDSMKKNFLSEDFKIYSNFEKARDNYAQMLDREKRKDIVSTDLLLEIIRGFEYSLDELYNAVINDIALSKDNVLEAIYTIIPLYANAILKYDTKYYYDYYEKIDNGSHWNIDHDKWLECLNKFSSPMFMDFLMNYCFVDKKQNNIKSVRTVATTHLLVFNAVKGIEDNQRLLESFEPEEYQELHKSIDSVSVKVIEDILQTTNPVLHQTLLNAAS